MLRTISAAAKKFPEPGIFENLEISRFCETASFCNPLLHFEVAESESELQIVIWIAYFIEKSIFRKMLHMARNFQTWLQDCVAARRDLEKIIRYSDCFYYSLPGFFQCSGNSGFSFFRCVGNFEIAESASHPSVLM